MCSVQFSVFGVQHLQNASLHVKSDEGSGETRVQCALERVYLNTGTLHTEHHALAEHSSIRKLLKCILLLLNTER